MFGISLPLKQLSWTDKIHLSLCFRRWVGMNNRFKARAPRDFFALLTIKQHKSATTDSGDSWQARTRLQEGKGGVKTRLLPSDWLRVYLLAASWASIGHWVPWGVSLLNVVGTAKILELISWVVGRGVSPRSQKTCCSCLQKKGRFFFFFISFSPSPSSRFTMELEEKPKYGNYWQNKLTGMAHVCLLELMFTNLQQHFFCQALAAFSLSTLYSTLYYCSLCRSLFRSFRESLCEWMLLFFSFTSAKLHGEHPWCQNCERVSPGYALFMRRKTPRGCILKWGGL